MNSSHQITQTETYNKTNPMIVTEQGNYLYYFCIYKGQDLMNTVVVGGFFGVFFNVFFFINIIKSVTLILKHFSSYCCRSPGHPHL